MVDRSATYAARMDDTVAEIAGMADPVLRNLCITQRYHEFAVALRDAGCGTDATWCAFAVWASKTAGATIRGEILPGRAKALIDDDSTQAAVEETNQGLADRALRKLTHDHLGRIVEDVTGDVSSQIAAGNVLVFNELAPLFTALVQGLGSEPVTEEALAAAMAPALSALGTDADAASVVAAFNGYGAAPFAGGGRAAAHPRRQYFGGRPRTAPTAAGHIGSTERGDQRHPQEGDRDRHRSAHPWRRCPTHPRQYDGPSVLGPRPGLGHGAH